MQIDNFLSELKRRNVYKVAVAYAIVGWLLVQVATQVFPFFEIPNWAVRLIVLAIVIGFPISLVIAWAFELTPEGIKSTEDADATAKQSYGRAWIYVAIIGAVLSLGLFVLGRYTANTGAPRHSQAATAPQKSIAILPFENLSEEKVNAYFAEGIKDEILTKLAAVRDLKVISRTSTAKYQSKPDNLKTVAQELGVSTILEGAVQRAGDKVRINVQLIDAQTDGHLWAKSYDRDFKDVLGVESDVAQEIAETLQANLSPSESHALASTRTSDTEAYDVFLRGEYELRQAEKSRTAEAYDRADAFYRQALARDPSFAETAAERSLADSQRAQELDPRDTGIPDNMAATYLLLRLWKDAERWESRSLAIDPHNMQAAAALLITRLNATGDVDSARRALDGFPEDTKTLTREWFAAGGDVAGFSGIGVYLDAIERRFTDAFQALEKKVVSNDLGHLQHLAARVALRVLAGEHEAAKSAGEEALPLLEAKLRERPEDTFVMMELAWVYLALGRNADALRLAREAAASIPIEKDAVAGPTFQIGLAQIEARAGAPEEAIKRLRHLLSIPAGQVASIARLKIDPVWDPIRNRPDFQQLLSGPEQIGPNK